MYLPGRVTSTDKQSVAHRIWTFIASRGSVGVIADAVLAQFPELGHTTVTARIHGLKHAGLIVRHPEGLVRKTRKGRPAEVWVVPPRTKFDPKKYREPKRLQKAQDVAESATNGTPCNHPHVTKEELELLALARAYGELGPHDEPKVDGAINALFDKIIEVYPVKR